MFPRCPPPLVSFAVTIPWYGYEFATCSDTPGQFGDHSPAPGEHSPPSVAEGSHGEEWGCGSNCQAIWAEKKSSNPLWDPSSSGKRGTSPPPIVRNQEPTSFGLFLKAVGRDVTAPEDPTWLYLLHFRCLLLSDLFLFSLSFFSGL